MEESELCVSEMHFRMIYYRTHSIKAFKASNFDIVDSRYFYNLLTLSSDNIESCLSLKVLVEF